MARKGRKWRFSIATAAETTTMEGSSGGAASGSIVLDAISEEDVHSYELLRCFSQPQTNFTTSAKTAPFHRCFDVHWGQRGGRMGFGGWLSVD